MFVLKDPLNWIAVWVGYGNATGYPLFLTSFLGVVVFSRSLKDTPLIVTGMVSFSTGMLIISFLKWTFLYFIGSFPRACATVASLCKLFQPALFYRAARVLMMVALIPLATIRSVISKQIKDTSYGSCHHLVRSKVMISQESVSILHFSMLAFSTSFVFILSSCGAFALTELGEDNLLWDPGI
ncbi:thymic stromal cotransporter protein-like isoform X2 [Carcharodon carcharias]|uniref:thymic stromal cotransporter protein-like isoform X2 n=1 Tax=Carcharodon carcharias TaxID=13397 RepID=UPI001B7E2125|nr:thymic stromal cotransporter protein-like isoform X2 [Carcharodon carcharias]